MKKVIVTPEVHDLLARTLKNARARIPFPICFLLGKRADGIVSKCIRLQLNIAKSCKDMSEITQTELTKKSLVLYSNGVIPCGIARVQSGVKVSLARTTGNRGNSLYEITKMGEKTFILTCDRNGIVAERYDDKEDDDKIKTLEYCVAERVGNCT